MNTSDNSQHSENSWNSSSPLAKKLKVSNSPKPSSSCSVAEFQPAPDTNSMDASVSPPSAPVSAPGGNAKRTLDLHSDEPPKWFTAVFSQFESRFDDRIKGIESLLDRKLGEVCEKLKSHDFEIGGLKDSVTQLQKENETLCRQLDELENRSRRKNIVLFGLPEAEKEDCLKTVSEFLQFAGVSAADASAIERCHRTPTWLGPDQKAAQTHPRRIHIGFATFIVKERVRRSCIQKLKESSSEYQGKKIFVAEDFSKRIIQLRKKKQEKFQSLKKEGKKPFFAYPDKLRYRDPVTGRVVSAD